MRGQEFAKLAKKQSPIDIIPKDTEKTDFDPLMWKNNATELGTVTVANSGHGFSVSNSKMSTLILSGGGLNGEYQLAQFHYHWGSFRNNYKGSEHRIDGKQWASEVHFVHFKTIYADLSAALASGKQDALAVVGVMLKRSTRNDQGFETALVQNLSDVVKSGSSTTMDFGSTNLMNFLPGDVKKFFRYEGSLTTPTCNEQVIWTVLEEDVTIPTRLLDKFPAIEDVDNSAITYSARDVLALNGRKVSRNSGVTSLPISIIYAFAFTVISIAFSL